MTDRTFPDPHHMPSRRGALAAAAVAIGGAPILLPGCAMDEKVDKKGERKAKGSARPRT